MLQFDIPQLSHPLSVFLNPKAVHSFTLSMCMYALMFSKVHPQKKYFTLTQPFLFFTRLYKQCRGIGLSNFFSEKFGGINNIYLLAPIIYSSTQYSIQRKTSTLIKNSQSWRERYITFKTKQKLYAVYPQIGCRIDTCLFAWAGTRP